MSEQQTPEQLPLAPARVESAPPPASYFESGDSFETGQRIAKMLCASDLVPAQYRGNIANTVLALEIARHTGGSPFFVMQNLHVIQGRPSWSAQFIIAVLNTCGRFKGGLKFEMDSKENPQTCRAWAIEAATGERIDGPVVSLDMASKEGWLKKPGSKWQTMPEVMLRYRAASFFGRLYAPDILLGMHSDEEVMEMDVPPGMDDAAQIGAGGAADINAILAADAEATNDAPTA